MAAKMIHTIIRVINEEASVQLYKTAFGFSIADKLDFEDFKLIYMSNKEQSFELEMTINKSQTAPYELGNDYGHLAFVTDDVESEHQRLTTAGLSPKDIVHFDRKKKHLQNFSSLKIQTGIKSKC